MLQLDFRISQVLGLLFSDLKGIRLVNECQGLVVLADSLLRQLFYNLIDNTLKYGEKTSVIKVHYEEEKDQLKLVYEDDGVGIPDEVRTNLFQEGYGKGTGYGLYLIQRICEAYGWKIQETGSSGEGARFTMTLPKKGEDGKECYKLSDGGSAGTDV
jgi:signal transduction histidine kinase